MIQLQKYTPDVYYNHSRDFQFIGRLYDIVLNSVKTNVDLLYNLNNSDNFNNKLIDLLTMTLGFRSKHNYSTKQLVALCSIFPTILKNKGNIQAVKLAGQTLLNAEGITEPFDCELVGYTLYLFIPKKLSDLNLFRDLLDYILPAGITCEMSRGIKYSENVSTEVGINNNVIIKVQESSASSVLYDDYAYAGDMTKSTLYNEGDSLSESDDSDEIITPSSKNINE